MSDTPKEYPVLSVEWPHSSNEVEVGTTRLIVRGEVSPVGAGDTILYRPPVFPETPQGLLWEEIKECIINGEYDEALHQHRALVASAVAEAVNHDILTQELRKTTEERDRLKRDNKELSAGLDRSCGATVLAEMRLKKLRAEVAPLIAKVGTATQNCPDCVYCDVHRQRGDTAV